MRVQILIEVADWKRLDDLFKMAQAIQDVTLSACSGMVVGVEIEKKERK